MNFNPTPKPTFGNIDIQEEVERLIDRDGFYVILIRPIMQMRCLCWNEQTKEARSDCQTCFGTGYLLKFERHKCRDFRTTDNFIAKSLQQFATGTLLEPAQYFYLKKQSNIFSNMFIVIAEWDGLNPIKESMEAFEVNIVDKHRGKGGKLEYYRVGAKSRPDITNRLQRAPIKNLQVIDK